MSRIGGPLGLIKVGAPAWYLRWPTAACGRFDAYWDFRLDALAAAGGFMYLYDAELRRRILGAASAAVLGICFGLMAWRL